jgi:hypothetical protein
MLNTSSKPKDDKVTAAKLCNRVPRMVKSSGIWLLPMATSTDQINEPLGMSLAYDMATKFGIVNNAFTEAEFYNFLYGSSPNWSFDVPRKTVVQQTAMCMINLSNTKGGVENALGLLSPIFDFPVFKQIPALASYGLKFSKRGNGVYITTDCAADQPCLVFNKYAEGPLEQICKDAGCLDKFVKTVSSPIFLRCVATAIKCQQKCASSSCMWNDDEGYHAVPTMKLMNLLNFALIFTLCPAIAAFMPKYSTPVAAPIANSLIQSNGEGIRLPKFKRLNSKYHKSIVLPTTH